jgi:hypothetical protein
MGLLWNYFNAAGFYTRPYLHVKNRFLCGGELRPRLVVMGKTAYFATPAYFLGMEKSVIFLGITKINAGQGCREND